MPRKPSKPPAKRIPSSLELMLLGALMAFAVMAAVAGLSSLTHVAESVNEIAASVPDDDLVSETPEIKPSTPARHRPAPRSAAETDKLNHTEAEKHTIVIPQPLSEAPEIIPPPSNYEPRTYGSNP